MKKLLVICSLLIITPAFANLYYFDGNGNSTFGPGEAYTDYDHIKIEKIEKEGKKEDKKKVEEKKSTESTTTTTTPKKSSKKKRKKKKLKAI